MPWTRTTTCAQILSRKINPRFVDEIVARRKPRPAAQGGRGRAADGPGRRCGDERGGAGRASAWRTPTPSTRRGTTRRRTRASCRWSSSGLNCCRHWMIRYHAHADDYLEMCRCYQNVDGVGDLVKEDEAARAQAACCAAWLGGAAPPRPCSRTCCTRSARTRAWRTAAAQAAHEAVHDEGDKIIHWDTLAEALAA